MSAKTASTPKDASNAPKTKAKAKPVKPKKNVRSLKVVVGPEVYDTWVSMLRTLVPGGRTHRLAPLLAAMLQHALSVAEDRQAEAEENTVIQSLLDSTEVSDPSEVKDLLHDAVTRLFKDAGVEYNRTSVRGQRYSIVEEAYEEYIGWFDMPWE